MHARDTQREHLRRGRVPLIEQNCFAESVVYRAFPKGIGASAVFLTLLQAQGATLRPETVQAWNQYCAAAQARMQSRINGSAPFLWTVLLNNSLFVHRAIECHWQEKCVRLDANRACAFSCLEQSRQGVYIELEALALSWMCLRVWDGSWVR